MKPDTRPFRFDTQQALDEGLAAWLGWFSRGPLSDNFISLIEQLEAAYRPSPRAAHASADV